MHIQKVHLKNIRSFENLEIDFGNSGAGWHVILGTNGTGKSTLIRSIALALVGEPEIYALAYKQSWKSWLRQGTKKGKIEVPLLIASSPPPLVTFNTEKGVVVLEKVELSWSLFSAAYGSLRRLSGGNPDYKNIWESNPRLAAHLSIFGEDVALDQSIKWLINLHIKGHFRNVEEVFGKNKSDNRAKFIQLIKSIKQFINTSALLPNGIVLSSINHEEIQFKDKNNLEVPITELSDGYRSILSLVLELVRQVCIYDYNDITKIFSPDKTKIITKGVVLIDEIDAHLHPTWQAKIGKWFTEYFPHIQFIVTTHSPIICRSADTGTIWKLSNEGKSTQIEQIKGIEKKQLIYGNILDAFETDLFGEDISRSEESKEILKEMAVLNVKRQVGRISDTEETRLKELEQIFPIDAKDNFLDD
jgi:predicted ATPase